MGHALGTEALLYASSSRSADPVVPAESTTGRGIDVLAAEIASHRAHLVEQALLLERRRRHLINEVLAIATQRIRQEVEMSSTSDDQICQLLEQVASRRIDPATAAAAVVDRFGVGGPVDLRPSPARE